jgi:hypothetical protein
MLFSLKMTLEGSSDWIAQSMERSEVLIITKLTRLLSCFACAYGAISKMYNAKGANGEY